MRVGQKADPRKAHWEPDELVPHCRLCLTSFTLTTRRHHCRACGQIFCGDCSRYYLLLPEEMGYTEPRRTCRTCLQRHSTLNYAQTCTWYFLCPSSSSVRPLCTVLINFLASRVQSRSIFRIGLKVRVSPISSAMMYGEVTN